MTSAPSPSAEQKLLAVREWIVKAVPEIMQHVYVGVESEWDERACVRCKVLEDSRDEYPCEGRDITLEDMLRLLRKTKWKTEMDADLLEHWRLGLPLDQQSAETISFLHHLLA